MGTDDTARIDRLVEQMGGLQGQLAGVQSSLNSLATSVARLVTAHESLVMQGCPGTCQRDIARLATDLQEHEHRIAATERGEKATRDIEALAERLRKVEAVAHPPTARRRRIAIDLGKLTGAATAGGGLVAWLVWLLKGGTGTPPIMPGTP